MHGLDLRHGGHGGQPGAGLDHAAIFEKYLRDRVGKIIGMDVEEQYKGSGGAHERAYYFGGGRGERDAANYAAIKTASGGYLGGRANPMSGDDSEVAGNAIKNAAPPRRRLAPPPQTDTGQEVMLENPLGLGNWQMTQRTAFSMHNKTGSDIFIAASTMAS